MPAPIRILVAEPFASQRRMIEEAAGAHDDMQICGSAESGRDAIELFRKTPVDIVVLNVDLACPDGPLTVKAIRALNANVPIVLFSTASVRGGEITLKALSAGASDFVARPSSVAGSTLKTFLATQLLGSIRTWHARASFRGINTDSLSSLRAKFSLNSRVEKTSVPPNTNGAGPVANSNSSQPSFGGERKPSDSPDVVVMGSSTGGPNALCAVLSGLRVPLAVPVLIVQHMPPRFTQFLAERLNSKTPFKVREAENGDLVTPDTILIAPGGQHLELAREGEQVVVQLSDKAPVRSCRPSVDVLFQSAVEVFGSRTLGVILTGMGSDGTNGCRRIKQAGGRVITQDRDSCVVWGMPRSVEEAGLADAVVPLEQIAGQIQKHLQPSDASPVRRQLAKAQ